MEKMKNRKWWLGAGLVVGSAAAAAYFLDSEHGASRRTRIAGRTAHAARTARRRAQRELSYARSTVRGRWVHATTGMPPEAVDGRTLLDRVESELFTDRSIPHGRLTFEVEGTTIILRGQVDSPDEMARIEAAVRRIPGVSEVRNLMHTPGTPAPNKMDALIASANAEAEERENSRLG
jgi:hypothetical protein